MCIIVVYSKYIFDYTLCLTKLTLISQPRHIEIQLIGDSHGNVVALPERECSIQRRNQKVLEEAPSVLLDESTRDRMQKEAVALAQAVDYQSAGTVEFLCDKQMNFYFLEMNTRLQVEHPITEMITGVDLVEQMIRVASGLELPKEWLTGKGLPYNGHAHEARIYAEDPFRGFLPSIGRLTTYVEPKGENVRCDSGVTQGSDISMHYDPMISKLCTWGETRQEALDLLEKSLDDYVIEGVGHNIPFVRDVTRSDRFRAGKLTTDYIPEEYPEGFEGVQLNPVDKVRLASVAAVVHLQRGFKENSLVATEDVPSPEGEFVTVIDGEAYTVKFNWEAKEFLVTTPDGTVTDSQLDFVDWTEDAIRISASFAGMF